MIERRRGIDSQIHRLGLPDVRTAGDLAAFVACWACVAVIAWLIFDPYGFRDAVLRALGVV